MGRQQLIADLLSLGLSQYESRAYVALVAEAPVTAYQLARNAGIPTSKVYEILAKLEERDLVAVIWGDPKQYAAKDPAEFVASSRQVHQQTMQRLEQEFGRLHTPRQQDYVWNLEGRAQIVQTGQDLLNEAKQTVVYAGPADLLTAWQAAMLATQERKLRLDILVAPDAGTPAAWQHEEHWLPLPVKIQRAGGAPAPRGFTLAVDSRKALLGGWGATDIERGAWTQHPAIVALAAGYGRDRLFLEEAIAGNRINWGQPE